MKKKSNLDVKFSEKSYSFTVILEPDLEVGGYTVSVAELPGCFTEGETLNEAMTNAREAIVCHLKGLLKDGEPVPSQAKTPTFVSQLVVASSELNSSYAQTALS